jgi:hypothetical protein
MAFDLKNTREVVPFGKDEILINRDEPPLYLGNLTTRESVKITMPAEIVSKLKNVVVCKNEIWMTVHLNTEEYRLYRGPLRREGDQVFYDGKPVDDFKDAYRIRNLSTDGERVFVHSWNVEKNDNELFEITPDNTPAPEVSQQIPDFSKVTLEIANEADDIIRDTRGRSYFFYESKPNGLYLVLRRGDKEQRVKLSDDFSSNTYPYFIDAGDELYIDQDGPGTTSYVYKVDLLNKSVEKVKQFDDRTEFGDFLDLDGMYFITDLKGNAFPLNEKAKVNQALLQQVPKPIQEFWVDDELYFISVVTKKAVQVNRISWRGIHLHSEKVGQPVPNEQEHLNDFFKAGPYLYVYTQDELIQLSPNGTNKRVSFGSDLPKLRNFEFSEGQIWAVSDDSDNKGLYRGRIDQTSDGPRFHGERVALDSSFDPILVYTPHGSKATLLYGRSTQSFDRHYWIHPAGDGSAVAPAPEPAGPTEIEFKTLEESGFAAMDSNSGTYVYARELPTGNINILVVVRKDGEHEFNMPKGMTTVFKHDIVDIDGLIYMSLSDDDDLHKQWTLDVKTGMFRNLRLASPGSLSGVFCSGSIRSKFLLNLICFVVMIIDIKLFVDSINFF